MVATTVCLCHMEKQRQSLLKNQCLIRNGGSQDFTLLESPAYHSTVFLRGRNFKKRKINIKTTANLLTFYVMYYKLSLALYIIFI